MELNADLQARLKSVSTLPTPPQVAVRIIELAQQAEPDLAGTAAAISKDPALTAKILRTANSPLYARRRRCDNLRQALIVLGLNATLTLALSFSLSASLRKGTTRHLDFDRTWRRSLLSGVVARMLARYLKSVEAEEFFLAALLQDIGMLAIDKAFPEVYECPRGLPADHRSIAELERERLGVDHARIGAWLLCNWQMPEFLCEAVAGSHDPAEIGVDNPAATMARAVALSGEIADLWLNDGGTHRSCEVAALASDWLGMDREEVSTLLAEVQAEMAETESLYDTKLLDHGEAEAIVEQARDILLVRNLQALNEVSALKATAETLETRAQELEEANRRDALTGVYNRAHLDRCLQLEYSAAREGGWPFTVMFADLDHFKRINDNYGHLAGDRLLIAVAGMLQDVTRPTDIVARYGGEEFVIVLPGNSRETALVVAERLVESFRSTQHLLDGEGVVTVTVSVGIATYDAQSPFEDVTRMVDAADKAVYQAKMSGRDRYCMYGVSEPAKAQEPVDA